MQEGMEKGNWNKNKRRRTGKVLEKKILEVTVHDVQCEPMKRAHKISSLNLLKLTQADLCISPSWWRWRGPSLRQTFQTT